MKSQKLFEKLIDNRIIALISPGSAEDCVRAYETLSPLGIVLEIAFRTRHAADSIRAVMERDPDALLLAGTVMTPAQAREAIQLGAAGIVSADYIEAVVDVCVDYDVMCVPGGLSDAGKQLARKAAGYGVAFQDLIEHHPHQWMHKLFPAVAGDLNFAPLGKAWKGPYPGLRLMYTGGVSSANLASLVCFDPEGVFCGSALTRSVDDPVHMRHEAEIWISIIKEHAR